MDLFGNGLRRVLVLRAVHLFSSFPEFRDRLEYVIGGKVEELSRLNKPKKLSKAEFKKGRWGPWVKGVRLTKVEEIRI